MALKIERTGDILHVTETLHGFTSIRTNHWYYDVRRWLSSSYGKEGDTPNRLMDAGAIEWVKKHYLPKAEIKR